MTDINPTVSIMTLTVKGLNNLVQGRDCQNGLFKNEVQLYTVYRTNTLDSRLYYIESKQWEK